jgi:hypothetical protein
MLRSVATRLAGLTILILGIWGGIIPFVGPYFHFTLGPDHAWTWTTGRLWLSVLPSIAAVIGGLWLLEAGPWASGRIGALLALVAGIWFVVGPELSILWHPGGQVGLAHGSTTVQMLERLSFHAGLGVLIAALAGYALPRALAPRTERTAAVAEGTAASPVAGRASAPPDGQTTIPPQDGITEQPTRPVRRERAGA